MSKKLLLSAPLGCPGAASALRNHQAILKSSIDCDFIPLEYLIFPISKKHTQMRRIYYSVSRRLKIVSINKILSYGENIIFGSFSPTYEIIVRQLNKHGIRPSFIWHSSLGQLEQTPGERELFMRIITLLERGKIKYLLLHRRLYDSLGYFIKGATYLPHSIELTPYRSISKKDLSGINVDLFCRLRYGKNVLNQILAFKMAELDGNLHINFDTEQFHGIIETISSQIVRHKWLPIEEYYSLISAMDISLQVTIGESFNYAVCERMALKVPVLTTADIYLVSDDSFLAKHLCVSAPDTPSEISRAMKKILDKKDLREELGERCGERISEVAKYNNKIVVDQIRTLFD